MRITVVDERRRERLRFRSWHRGTREMDLLLGSFADRHVPDFSDSQLDAYEALLCESDPDLYAWITGTDPVPDDRKNDVLAALLAHQFATKERA